MDLADAYEVNVLRVTKKVFSKRMGIFCSGAMGRAICMAVSHVGDLLISGHGAFISLRLGNLEKNAASMYLMGEKRFI